MAKIVKLLDNKYILIAEILIDIWHNDSIHGTVFIVDGYGLSNKVSCEYIPAKGNKIDATVYINHSFHRRISVINFPSIARVSYNSEWICI